MGPKNAAIWDLYRLYVNNVVNDFEEHKLVEENPEFKNLMDEYRDGIMLFELMDRNVWGKASKDSVGLAEFYKNRKQKYMWEPGFKGAVYKFKTEAQLKEGVDLIKKNEKDEDIVKKLNVATQPDNVSIQKGRYEFSKFREASRTDIVAGKLTRPIKNADNSYNVVKVDEVYDAPTEKSLDEARGYVVAEYQDYLEKEWNKQMRGKYPVKINEDVLKSLVK
jgi:peptidyl-prolyl cis-trans isomerase SurA